MTPVDLEIKSAPAKASLRWILEHVNTTKVIYSMLIIASISSLLTLLVK